MAAFADDASHASQFAEFDANSVVNFSDASSMSSTQYDRRRSFDELDLEFEPSDDALYVPWLNLFYLVSTLKAVHLPRDIILNVVGQLRVPCMQEALLPGSFWTGKSFEFFGTLTKCGIVYDDLIYERRRRAASFQYLAIVNTISKPRTANRSVCIPKECPF